MLPSVAIGEHDDLEVMNRRRSATEITTPSRIRATGQDRFPVSGLVARSLSFPLSLSLSFAVSPSPFTCRLDVRSRSGTEHRRTSQGVSCSTGRASPRPSVAKRTRRRCFTWRLRVDVAPLPSASPCERGVLWGKERGARSERDRDMQVGRRAGGREGGKEEGRGREREGNALRNGSCLANGKNKLISSGILIRVNNESDGEYCVRQGCRKRERGGGEDVREKYSKG